jgi:hypothetical protein
MMKIDVRPVRKTTLGLPKFSVTILTIVPTVAIIIITAYKAVIAAPANICTSLFVVKQITR